MLHYLNEETVRRKSKTLETAEPMYKHGTDQPSKMILTSI
jgi:hypothetical protein